MSQSEIQSDQQSGTQSDASALLKKRVVITGMGAITPLGNTLGEYWQGLMSAKNGIGLVTAFDASKHASQIAGEVKGFDPLDYMDRKDAKRAARFAHFAIAGSKQALADAKLEIDRKSVV